MGHCGKHSFTRRLCPVSTALSSTYATLHTFWDTPVKIFDNEDFGFSRITVERPLQLNFQASPERIARLDDERTWQNLLKSKKKNKEAAAAEIAAGRSTQADVLRVLARLDAERVRASRPSFVKELKAAAKAEDVKLSAPLQKVVLSALSERDVDCEGLQEKGETRA